MTVVTGNGAGNLAPWYVLSSPFSLSAADSSSFTASNSYGTVVVFGSGFTYAGNSITGGTITSLGYAFAGAGAQGWAGFSVSAVSVFNAIAALDRNAFANLFFSGGDVFNYTDPGIFIGPIVDPPLYGFGGNDVFNITNTIGGFLGPINGGSGNDTLNITGGVDTHAVFASPADFDVTPNATNFYVANIETVNLGAGSDYLILAASTLVPAGTSLTINGSALGPLNRFIFNTNAIGGNNNAGNLTLIGGAGNDWFQPGIGFNSFDGGAGTNTIDFSNSTSAVTVSLLSYPNSFSSGSATGTLRNIQDAIGSRYDDHITGNSGNNSLTGGGGNNVIDGGAGWDRAIYSRNYASYTITSIGHYQYTVSGPDGTDTLTNIEQLVFADRTIAIGIAPPPFNFTGDFGQQKSDILWQNENGQVAIWRMKFAEGGRQAAIYDQALIGSNPGPSWRIKGAGDFDGDGRADILWQNDSGQAQIWFMDASVFTLPALPLTVRSASLIGSNPGPSWHVIGTGDFDGDGRADILWQNNNGQAAIWLMNGPVMVGDAQVGSNPGPNWHIKGIGDFDGDGKSDILWQSDTGAATIWYMNGTTVANTAQVIGGSPGPNWRVVGVGDFDGDLKADILWQNDSGSVQLWLMDGVGPTSIGSWYVGPGWNVKGTADLNGLGRSDILWQSTNGQAAAWMMDGITVLGQTAIGDNPGASWQIANHGIMTRKVKNDFDGDHKADLLWQSETGQAALWFMNGAALVNSAAVGNNPGPSWHVKGSGDFDGDGKSDILWQNDNGQAALWLMNGTTVTGGVAISNNPGPSWHVMGAGDFDGDGKSDILWQNDSGQVALWFMDGINFTRGALLGNPGASWHVKGTGDFNGDGKSDILWQNDSGQAMLWLMDGSTVTSGDLWIGSNPGPSWHVKGAGDFDGDGKSDVLWQNDNGQAVIWTMNGGLLLNSAAVGSNPGPGWQVVGASDIDGYGQSDILWQSTSGQAAAWMMSGTNVLSTAAIGVNPGPGWHVIASGN